MLRLVLRVLGSVLAGIALAATAFAQSNSEARQPYAAINPHNIGYAGPDRASGHDLKGPEIRIGLLAPLQGPRKAEGEASILAARLALEDRSDWQGGRGLSLVVGDESGSWGASQQRGCPPGF
jgi:hypothetical protein